MKVRIDGKEHELEVIDQTNNSVKLLLISVGIGLVIVIFVAFKIGIFSL